MPIRKMCRSTGVSYSSAHFTNWHIIYLDRTSFLIKETYDKAKHTTVAAINPVSCGQTTKRLWPKGNGLGIAPCTCSIVSGPRLLTEGISNVIVASLNNSLGAKRSKPLVSDHLIVRSPSRRTQCLSDKVDNHIIEHAEKQPDRHTSQCRSRRLFKTD